MFLPTVYHLITIPLTSFSDHFFTDFSISDCAHIPRPVLHNCLQSTKFESSLPITVQLTSSLAMVIDRTRDSSAVLIEIYLLSLTDSSFWSSRVDWHGLQRLKRLSEIQMFSKSYNQKNYGDLLPGRITPFEICIILAITRTGIESNHCFISYSKQLLLRRSAK